MNKTINFLQSLHHNDGSFDSVKVAYYVLKTLKRLDSKLEISTQWLEQIFTFIISGFTVSDIYLEATSEIENAHLAIELLKTLKLTIDPNLIMKQISKLHNNDGSFGSSKRSKIASTYHALAILKILNYKDPETTRRNLEWIRRCEVPSGGFVGEPDFVNTIY